MALNTPSVGRASFQRDDLLKVAKTLENLAEQDAQNSKKLEDDIEGIKRDLLATLQRLESEFPGKKGVIRTAGGDIHVIKFLEFGYDVLAFLEKIKAEFVLMERRAKAEKTLMKNISGWSNFLEYFPSWEAELNQIRSSFDALSQLQKKDGSIYRNRGGFIAKAVAGGSAVAAGGSLVAASFIAPIEYVAATVAGLGTIAAMISGITVLFTGKVFAEVNMDENLIRELKSITPKELKNLDYSEHMESRWVPPGELIHASNRVPRPAPDRVERAMKKVGM